MTSPPGPPGWLLALFEAAGERPVTRALRPPAAGGRPSAVLVLFADGEHGPDLLLIQRSAVLRNHAGQPAFPGGALDPADGAPAAGGLVNAALREATEETGLDPAGVDVLGSLPELYVRRSGFRVTPVLAWWRTPSEVRPVDLAEVAAVARVPVRDLADPANRVSVRHPSGYTGPGFRVSHMLVWGFTGGVIDGLLELGGWARPWDRDRTAELPDDAAGRSVPGAADPR